MSLRTLTFTETVDGVTYTARTSLPVGARLLDVLLETTEAWTAASADLDVGDADAADALITAYDLTSVAFKNADGSGAVGGAWGNDGGDGAPYGGSDNSGGGGSGKLYPNGATITAVVTAGTPGGPTGLSSVSLLFEFAGARRAAVAAV